MYGSGHSGTTGASGTTGNTGPTSSTTGTTGLGSSTTGTHEHTSSATSGLGSDTSRVHDPTSHNHSALGDTSSRTAGAYDDDTSSTTAIRGGVPGTNTHSGSGLTDTNKPLPNEPGRLGTFGHLEEGGRKNEPFSSSTTDTTGTGLTDSRHTGSGITGTDHRSTTHPTMGTNNTGAGIAGSDYGSTTLPDRSVGG